MTARSWGTTTEVTAPAKLTVGLRIVGIRDDGLHLIDAEMVSVDLADTLTISPTPPGRSPTLEFRGPAANGIEAGPTNLVTRALAAVDKPYTDVIVEKNIPAGGGLGGGSADAAAILRWAGNDDLEVAVGLGADVAFCLQGGRARVTGIGEVLEPLPFLDQTFTFATPDFGCDTAAVYRMWDDLGGPSAAGPNDLEPAALRVEPRLAEFRDAFGESTGLTPILAGSGSTWFVEGSHPGPGRVVVNTIGPY